MELATPTGNPAPELDDDARVANLRDYGILNTGQDDEDFNLLTATAAQICGMPYAYVSLVDRDHVWIKSSFGRPNIATPRGDSYCAMAVAHDGLYVPDLRADPRTANMASTVGGPKFRTYAGAVLRSPEGHRLGTLCVLDDQQRELSATQRRLLDGLARQAMALIELRRKQRELETAMGQLETLAQTDALTGLANRRQFDKRLEEAFARLRRGGAVFAIVMLDLDHFKQGNDTHGHDGGDLVLQALASQLRHSTRAVDVAARLGGEEFCVLLEGDSAANAQLWAERLRQRLAEHPASIGTARVLFTASLGVAAASAGGGDTPESLLKQADLAMYEAKRNGRNRVVVAPAAA